MRRLTTKPKTGARLGPEQKAKIVADAMEMSNKRAAEFWKISVRTVERYVAESNKSPELTDMVAKKLIVSAATSDERWKAERVEFLRFMVRKMTDVFTKCDESNLREMIGAVKIVGELHSFAGALEPRSIDERTADAEPGSFVSADGGADRTGAPATIQ